MSKLPRDWKIKGLSEVAVIQTGLAKGKNNLKDPVSLPYLRVANVQDSYFDLSEIKTIEVSSAEVERYRLKPNDVLLTEGGDFDKLGRGHIWKGQIDPCLHQNHIFVVRPNPQILQPEFLTELTASLYGRRYFLSCSKQTTNLASVNSTQLKQFPVLLPPMREQKEITKILGCWDRATEQTEKLIIAKTCVKRSLMQQLLAGRNRFPKFKDQNWGQTTLGEVFSDSATVNTDNQISNVITVGKYAIRPQLQHFTRSVASKTLSNYKVIVKGDFVYDPMSAYYGAFGRYELDDPGIVSPVYRVIKLKEGISSDFIKHLIKSHRVVHAIDEQSSQGNKPGKRRGLQREAFASISIPLPGLQEQERIAAALNACDKEITSLKQQLDALKRQKRGLMQKLLTGQIRVKI